MEWQSIETAPKDGTNILIWTNQGVVDAWFCKGKWIHTLDGPEYTGSCWVCYDDAFQIEVEEWPGGEVYSAAKFWMPLPKPPIGELQT